MLNKIACLHIMVIVNLTIASINCRGLNDHIKRKHLFEVLGNSNYSVIFLQETHLEPSDHVTVRNEWKNGPLFINSVFGKKAGTAVLVNSFQIKILGQIVCDGQGRTIAFDIELEDKRFHLVNTYFPDKSTDRFTFIHGLHRYLLTNYPIVWGGDFNMVSDPALDRSPPRRYADSHSGDLHFIFDSLNLVDSCRELWPNRKIFSFRRPNLDSVSLSRIDKIMISSNLNIIKYDHTDYPHSDHDIICCQLHISSNFSIGSGVWRNNVSLFSSGTFVDEFTSLWEKEKQEKISMYSNNIGKWWNIFKITVKRFCIQKGKSLKCEQQREKLMMLNVFEHFQNELSSNPNDPRIRKQYFDYKEKIRKLQLKETEEKILKDKVENLIKGNKPTKEFFPH